MNVTASFALICTVCDFGNSKDSKHFWKTGITLPRNNLPKRTRRVKIIKKWLWTLNKFGWWMKMAKTFLNWLKTSKGNFSMLNPVLLCWLLWKKSCWRKEKYRKRNFCIHTTAIESGWKFSSILRVPANHFSTC